MAELVVVTGASGFVAKHVVQRCLGAGFAVRATLRDAARAEEVRKAVMAHLPEELAARLTFATADLTRDAGWAEAMAGAEALIHTASPFPIRAPDDPDTLIRPAVDGTLRALKAAAAAGIGRVVLTSSVAAIVHDPDRVHDEDDWADASGPVENAYSRSKTMAERAAWEFAAATPDMALSTINPGFVVGPPLDATFGSSIGLVRRILRGRDPMLPAYGLPMVDVRDVAEMHLRALLRPETAGKRYIAAAGSMWLTDIGKVLKETYPARRIPTRTAPRAVLRLLSLFDRDARAVLPRLGQIEQVSSARAVAEMGMIFIPPDEAVRASAQALLDHGLA